MPSRELVYRILINTATAKREAGNIRSAFEKELRQISVGKLDTRQLQAGTQQARQLRNELEQAAESGRRVSESIGNIQVPNIGSAISGIFDNFNIPPALLGGGLAVGGIALALAPSIAEMARLGTESIRTTKAFEILSGGATLASANIDAIRDASGGTVSSFQAMQIGNQALALGLANTAEGFARLTQAARAVAFVSPVINDIQSAISELGLAAANTSYRRLDQLGLSVAEVRAEMSKLRRENEGMSESQAFLEASVGTLVSKYGDILKSEEARATGLERISAAIQDIKTAAAEEITVTVNYIANPLADLFEGRADVNQATEQFLNSTQEAYRIVDQNIKSSDPVSQDYIDGIRETVKLWEDGQLSAADYRIRIDGLVIGLQNYEAQLKQTTDAATKLENDRLSSIFDQQPAIGQSLSGRAAKAAPTVGIEQSIALYQQQKAQVEQLLQQLADTGISDTGEIAIRVAAITQELMKPFDELEARASQGFAVDFSAIGSAFTSLNQSFVDFLPGIASARDELAVLSEELAYTGSMSAEQAAQFEYLSSVAYAVADSGSQLNGVVNELGTQFLSSNAYAAELVNQLFLAEAAFRNGQISAGQYAGMTAALTGNLLTLAQGAGIATNAIYALNQAQSDMSNLPGFAGGQQVGGSIAQRIQTQQAASGREQNRREMERYNAAVARQQETSARRAGKALEDGAKKASDALKNALDKVPGLFSTTSVTEQDVKDTEMGIYKEKADEYLRRLRDEVVNGKQWEDVSIEEARAGLERAGLEVGNTAEQTLALLEKAMNDSSLYSAAENIPIFINEEAVKYAQDLQNKSEQGRKNIYEYFGVQVDEAVSAATGGGGGAPAPVAPPKLVDIDPYTDGMQTGLDEYVDKNGQLIQEQIANAPGLMVDLDKLFAPGTALSVTTTGAMSMAAPASQMQPMSMNALASQKPGMAAQSLDITPTLPEDAAEKLALALGDQLSKQAAVFMSHGSSIGGNIINGLSAAMSLNAKGETQIDVAGFIAGNLSAQAATFIAQGTGIATLIGQGIDEGLAGAGSTATIAPTIHPAFVVAEVEKQNIISAVGAIVPTVNVALAVSAEAGTMTALVQSINTELRKIQPDIAREGATVSAMLTGGITASLSSTDTPLSIAQPLSTALITDIATNAALFATPGTVVAQLIMAAILAHMQGQQQGEGGGEGGGGPIAAALVTNLITQFATAAPQFTAAGIVPAQIVEAGFKGHTYTGMADNLQASVMQAIGSKAGEFVTAGSYIGGWIQQGINSAFTAEVNLSFAVNAGASWGTAFMKGALSAVGGGTLVQAISDKVITDLATEMEQP